METLHQIMQEAPQACLAREISRSWGILTLTQVGFPQSTGVQQEAQSQNISDPPKKGQVHRPGRRKLDNQLYQSQRSLVNF